MDGFGEKIIQRLHEEKLLMTISDLYTLKNHYATLITLDRLGKKVVDKLLERVELSKSMPLGKFIEAISIKNTGQGTAKRLLRYYDDIDQIMNATYEDFLKIEDIGGVVARSLVDYFKQNRAFIETMKSHGINLKGEPKARPTQGGLAGMKICLTGTLSRPRKEYEDLISAVGGEFVEEVTKTTNLLVTNDPNSGSSKLKNAAKYGTKIVNEENLMTLLKGNNTMKAETKKATGGVAGLKICITGTLSKPRKDYEKAIAAAGGEAVDEVTKTTNILVTNDPNAGSSKLKNAAKHGTKIMSEADLVKLLGIK
jgi:DNA ligase (NAD+)